MQYLGSDYGEGIRNIFETRYIESTLCIGDVALCGDAFPPCCLPKHRSHSLNLNHQRNGEMQWQILPHTGCHTLSVHMNFRGLHPDVHFKGGSCEYSLSGVQKKSGSRIVMTIGSDFFGISM